MAVVGKRITFKRKRPNPLFQEWLEELYEEAKTKKSKLELTLKEALESISSYPLPLKTGSECAILKGFNKKLCLFMDMRLDVYNNGQKQINCKYDTRISKDNAATQSNCSSIKQQAEPVVCLPLQNTENIVDVPEVVIDENNGRNSKKQTKTQKTYKPVFRSGSYAILMALLEYSKENVDMPSLTKELLIERAQTHSEESFTRPKPNTYYTAWSNISKMITKGLVKKFKNGKKLEYMLTNDGVILAEELFKEAKSKTTNNNLIFNTSFEAYEHSNEIIVENVENVGDLEKTPKHVNECNNSEEMPLIEMLPDSFDIILLIDIHETSGLSKKSDPTVAQFNKYPDLKHEYRSLKVGDFTWIARSKADKDQEIVLPYIVERKRMDDLGSSIKDGRFHEQKFRLRKCGLDNVIYLIENYGSNKHLGLPLQSLMQALANTRTQDGFRVHTTNSLTDSAKFLAIMTKRLTIEYQKRTLYGKDGPPENKELMTFSYFNKSSCKNKALSVTETFIKLLLQLKGMSVDKALAITSVYKTPATLINAYKNLTESEGEMLLANLKNNLGRNVGPFISKAMYKLFSSVDLV